MQTNPSENGAKLSDSKTDTKWHIYCPIHSSTNLLLFSKTRTILK